MMEGYEDPLYDEALLANIPEEFRDFTLEKLVHNRIELEHFRNFLAENYASMDIMCWMDIEAFKVHGLAIVNIPMINLSVSTCYKQFDKKCVP